MPPWTGRPSWGRGNTVALKEALKQGSNLRLCIDGGRRSKKRGAIGFAIYGACGSSPHRSTYALLLRGGKLLESVESAFLAEAMALEWGLERLLSLVESVASQ